MPIAGCRCLKSCPTRRPPRQNFYVRACCLVLPPLADSAKRAERDVRRPTPPTAFSHILFSARRPTTPRTHTMRTLLCVLLCLIAHVSAGRVTPAARSPAQRLRGNQPSRTAMHDDRRIARSDRVSLVATRRRAGDERAPKASNAECRGAPQRETRGRMMESPPRGADYRGCPRRCSGGMQCDMPSDSGMLACSF